MALTADQIMPTIGPYLSKAVAMLWFVSQLLIGAVIVYLMITILTYNVKVNVRDYSKGGRVIAWTTKAREFTDKKTNTPKLKFFGTMGFAGKEINQPPSECIIPYKPVGFGPRKMYDFVRKDGIFYPVENQVLGRLVEVGVENGKPVLAYSTEGSGLEISRDYDSEQAIQNTLIQKAQAYRNEKPSALYAMYGLAIILAIGSFIVMIYGWNQFGNVGDAIMQLKEPLKEGVAGALSQKLGP